MTASEYLQNLRRRLGSELLLLPSVAAVVLNQQGALLLQQKHDLSWSLPAGMIEPGESPAQAIVRELKEETGLMADPIRVLGVFGGAGFSYQYANGDQVAYVITLFLCQLRSGQQTYDTETYRLAYFEQNKLPPLSVPYPLEVLFADKQDCVF